MIENLLSAWLTEAFGRAFPDLDRTALPLSVTAATQESFGDYQCNAALPAAKLLKKNPREVAQAVVQAAGPHDAIDRIEIAGPGFINLFLRDDILARRVEGMADDPRCGTPPVGEGRTVILDYSSPNVAKPMHIGHIRSTVIGNALDRMFRFLGYRVVSDNHLGDWGTQFGILIMGFRHFVDAKRIEESPVEELERVYVASYDRTKDDPAWLDQARQELVKLQCGDTENLALWRRFIDLSLKEFGRLYDRLGVSFDLVRGESYYNDRLPDVLARLTALGLLAESEGAKVVHLDDEKLPLCIVQKTDGGFNYTTTDLATALSRDTEFQPERIVYVTDERQQLHFRQVFSVARKLGVKTRLEHVWFGLMRLPEGIFSTRQGNVIKLERLLDEAEARALAIVKESSPDMPEAQQRDVARSVGLGAVKYADLSHDPQSTVVFTWDKALALDGNSAPYLQYACARINSVLDKFAAQFPSRDLRDFPVRIGHPSERRLAVKLLQFPMTVQRAAEAYRPNVLADYLYELSQLYSGFYQNVPFLKAEEGVRESRLRLCAAVAVTLKKGLDLLGIETPERI